MVNNADRAQGFSARFFRATSGSPCSHVRRRERSSFLGLDVATGDGEWSGSSYSVPAAELAAEVTVTSARSASVGPRVSEPPTSSRAHPVAPALPSRAAPPMGPRSSVAARPETDELYSSVLVGSPARGRRRRLPVPAAREISGAAANLAPLLDRRIPIAVKDDRPTVGGRCSRPRPNATGCRIASANA
jgi:hypothetical protein